MDFLIRQLNGPRVERDPPSNPSNLVTNGALGPQDRQVDSERKHHPVAHMQWSSGCQKTRQAIIHMDPTEVLQEDNEVCDSVNGTGQACPVRR